MIHKTILFLTVLMLMGVGFLFYVNMTPLFLNHPKEKYISYNEVSGIAIETLGKTYTLNFEQQNYLLKYFNELRPSIGYFASDKNEQPDFEKIIIYRFNKPDLIIKPISFDNSENLLFDIQGFNKDGLMYDVSFGKMKKLIFNAHSPS